jgi:hypothetical protein
MAILTNNIQQKTTWSSIGWRIKKGVLFQSDYIEHLETLLFDRLGSMANHQDIKNITA